MRAVWNAEKARTNVVKHRLSFELASEVFDDDHHFTNEDPFAVGERRFITMGLVRGVGLIVVVHTIENENNAEEYARIISARRAERYEKKAFEDGRR